MFYSQLVLAKKGPLGRVWLAAHWDRKLTKTQINATDIAKSVDSIMRPEVPFALRMSGHLLLGVVRIYSRKVKYLLSDCNDALLKIKMAFRPGMVDLPADANVATVHSITLPEHAGDVGWNIPMLDDITLEPFGEELFKLDPLFKPDHLSKNKSEINLPPSTGTQGTQKEDEIDILDNLEDGDDLEDEVPKTPKTPEMGREGLRTPVSGATNVGEFATPGQEEFVTPGGAGGDYDFPPPFDFTPETPHTVPSPKTPFSEIKPFIEESIETNIEGVIRPASDEQQQEVPRTPQPAPTLKRKIDQHTELASRYIKEQLKNTGPITREMVLAPVTKKALLQREREKDVGTLYKITNIDGLGAELLELFAYSMVDGDREVGEVEEPRPSNITPPITPFSPPRSEKHDHDHEFPAPEFEHVEVGVDVEPELFQVPSSPKDDLDDSITVETGGEGEVPQPLDVSPDEPMSERTKKMHAYLRNKTFTEANTLSYLDLVRGKKAHTVAGTFFELLVLKSRNIIELEQDEPYADIRIKKTDHFYDTHQDNE